MSRPKRSEHPSRSDYVHGCRCNGCREANRLYAEERRRAAGMRPLDVACPPSPHGSINRYQGHGCRCDECRAANAGSKRRYRARLKVTVAASGSRPFDDDAVDPLGPE